jgi:hypothetical protein
MSTSYDSSSCRLYEKFSGICAAVFKKELTKKKEKIALFLFSVGHPQLMDPAPDPGPTPNPTPFFSDFKNAKKFSFFHIFSYNSPTGTLSSVLKI